MNAKVSDLMAAQVMTATPHQTFDHVKSVLASNRGSCLPVVGPQEEPLGIVTANDLLGGHAGNSTVSSFMTKKVYTIPENSDVSLAARIMRNHHIHHVVVTRKQAVCGIISSFDLLKLVEDHRFVMKNAPDISQKKKGGKRRQHEVVGDDSE